MKDGDKTKKQLIKELAELRRRVAGLDVPENEHAREEEALRDSEGRFRAVFETAQDSIFIKDRALRYILVNPAMERLFELPAAKLVGLTDRDLFGEDAGTFISKVDSRVLGGETVKAEHAKPVKGAVKTFDVIKVPIRDRTGNVVGLCGIARDITERKRADDELKGMTSSLQALVQTIPDVVYFKDLQGRNLVVNGAFEKLAGLKAAEIIGKTDELFFPPELARQCKFSDDEVMRSQKTLRFEEQAADRDGKKIFFETIKTPLYDDHGKVVGLVGVSRDVTERKTAEEALRESQGQLRSLAVHLQQIQEKERSRIARDIHDEFGQLLTAMKYDLSW
ncbi:MAG: PAS domain-containing protein, partial [Deltaproteobacteria bacterium]|nr:PAS domain-containing protein [Deltaproteobacteria bacterium]